MPTDDFASRERAQPFQSERGPAPPPRADELEEAADRLEDASWDRYDASPGGAAGGRPALEAQEEPGLILGFLEDQLRERPLPTLLAAVAAGWLVGKLLR